MSTKNAAADAQVSTEPPSWRARLVTLAAGGAAIAYALFIFVPAQRSISESYQTVCRQQSRISQSLTLVQPIRELENKLATTENFVTSWRAAAPAPKQLAAVFAELISLAREHDAEVTSLVPQAEQPLDTIGLIPVSLQATGSYRSLRELLARLEAMSGRVWIEDLHLQPLEKQADTLTCTIKLIIFANRVEISS